MDNQVDKIEILIKANADQFRRELDMVNSKLAGLSAKSAISAGTIAKGMLVAQVAIKAFSYVAGKVVGVVKNMASEAISGGGALARMSITNQVLARNMGISSEKLDSLRKNLAESNTYALNAERVIKSLAQSGLVTLSDKLSYLDSRNGQMLQGVGALAMGMKDLGASAGIDSSEAIERLTAFIRTGTASMADGILEIARIDYYLNQYAKSVGKTSGQLSEQEQAFVRMKVVMEEAQKTLGAYASTYQSSNKAFQSTTSAIKSMAQSIGSNLEPILGVVSNAFLQFWVTLRNGAEASGQSLRNWAIKVAGYLVAVINIVGKLGSSLPLVGKAFQALADFRVKPLKLSLRDVKDTSDQIGVGTGNNLDSANKKAKELKKTLAGFDEMNVLSNKDEGGSSSNITGGSGFNIGSVGDLGQIEDYSTQINSYADKIFKKFKWLNWQNKIVWGDMWNTFLKEVSHKGSGIYGSVKTLFSSIYSTVIKPFSMLVTTIFIDTFKIIKETWDKYGEDIKHGVWGFVQNTINIFQALYDNILSPIIEPLLKTFKDLWEGTLKDVFKEVGYFTGTLISSALEIYNGFIAPVVIYLTEILKPVFSLVGKIISGILKGVLGTIGGVAGGIIQALRGIIDFLMGAFTWNWRRAWDGIKNIFSGISGVLASIFKYPINSIILSINSFIKGLNRIRIPNWVPHVGGRGFYIPEIPRLAKGGVVTGSTIANIGEAGREVVLPLDRNTQWADLLVDKLDSVGGKAINLTVQIGEEKIGERIIDYIRDKSLRTGTNLLNL